SRRLGMGDVLTLIEGAEEAIDEKKAAELEKKLRTQQVTLDDCLEQLQQVRSMVPIDDIIGMFPGVNMNKLSGMALDERQIMRTEAIIQSMTMDERTRSEEHTSELQSRENLVCRLLLEKKKKMK